MRARCGYAGPSQVRANRVSRLSPEDGACNSTPSVKALGAAPPSASGGGAKLEDARPTAPRPPGRQRAKAIGGSKYVERKTEYRRTRVRLPLPPPRIGRIDLASGKDLEGTQDGRRLRADKWHEG